MGKLKVLFIISGSVGHLSGLNIFLEYIEPQINQYIASHIRLSQSLKSSARFYKLKSLPVYLNSELYLNIPLKTRIHLKVNNVFFHNRKQELALLIDSASPHVIIIDNYNFTDALIIAGIYKDSDIKVIFYQTRLSTELGFHGKYGGAYKNSFKWLSSGSILRNQKMNRFLNQFSMPGFSDQKRIKQLVNHLDFNFVDLNQCRYGIPSLTFLPELILSGEDLSNFHADNQSYMGMGIEPSWNDKMIQGQKNIMISIGSRDISNDIVSEYLKGILALIASMNGVQYFIPEPLKSSISCTNVTYYTWQTYHDHLAQADLHITHGGINSIKDSLSYAVPMLICPLDWGADQIHNALMFEKIGLARKWNLKKDSLENIRGKIDEILEGDYKERIKNYVAADRERYPAEKVREEFEELIRDERWEVRNW